MGDGEARRRLQELEKPGCLAAPRFLGRQVYTWRWSISSFFSRFFLKKGAMTTVPDEIKQVKKENLLSLMQYDTKDQYPRSNK